MVPDPGHPRDYLYQELFMRLKGSVSEKQMDRLLFILTAVLAGGEAAWMHRELTTKTVCEQHAVLNPTARSSMTALTAGPATCWRVKEE